MDNKDFNKYMAYGLKALIPEKEKKLSLRGLSEEYKINRERVTRIVKANCESLEKATPEQIEIIRGQLREISQANYNKQERLIKTLSMKGNRQITPVDDNGNKTTIEQRLNIAYEEYNYILEQMDITKELLKDYQLINDRQTLKADYRKDVELLNIQSRVIKELEEEQSTYDVFN